jgi:hypothetical protein
MFVLDLMNLYPFRGHRITDILKIIAASIEGVMEFLRNMVNNHQSLSNSLRIDVWSMELEVSSTIEPLSHKQ